MSQPFSIDQTDGPVTILHLRGELDAQGEQLLVEHARRAQAGGAQKVLADLTSVELITSAGLRALHTTYKLFTPNEAAENWKQTHAGEVFKSPFFKLAGASPQVSYVLNIAGFLQNIAIYASVPQALESFRD